MEIEQKIIQHMFDDPPYDPLYFRLFVEEYNLVSPAVPSRYWLCNYTLSHLQETLVQELWNALFSISSKPRLVCGSQFSGMTTAFLYFSHLVCSWTDLNIMYISQTERESHKQHERFLREFYPSIKNMTFVSASNSSMLHRGMAVDVIILDLIAFHIPEWVLSILQMTSTFAIVSYTRHYSIRGPLAPYDRECVLPDNVIELFDVVPTDKIPHLI